MPATSRLTSVGLRIERLPAREGQQPVGQRRGALGGALRGGDVAVELVDAALRHARLQQLQAAGDAGQQVVEVVREAAGELAHRLHLLRLAQLLLQLLALGDVAAGGVDLVVLGDAVPAVGAIGAVLGAQPHVEVANDSALQQPREAFADRSHVGWMHQAHRTASRSTRPGHSRGLRSRPD